MAAKVNSETLNLLDFLNLVGTVGKADMANNDELDCLV